MTRWFSLALALSLVALGWAQAAEPPSPSNPPVQAGPSGALPNEPDRLVIPKRKLTFDTSSEPMRVEDPALEDQHYVAELTMKMPPLRVCQPAKWQLPAADNSTEPCARVRLLNSRFRGTWTNMELVKSLLGHMPGDRQPPGSLLDALGTPRVGRKIGQVVNSYSTTPYLIYAPTSSRAKELAEAFLNLYDNGLSYPVQQECLREIQRATKELAAANKGLEESRAAIAEADKQLERLKDYADIDATALATYRAQQRMLEVDLAGTMARIQACDRILRGNKKLPDAQAEQVETVKITAEIELQGLAARRSAISKIVGDGQRRVAAFDRKIRETELEPEWQFRITVNQDRIAMYTTSRQEWAASPMEGNQVIIRPVEWQAPPKPKK